MSRDARCGTHPGENAHRWPGPPMSLTRRAPARHCLPHHVSPVEGCTGRLPPTHNHRHAYGQWREHGRPGSHWTARHGPSGKGLFTAVYAGRMCDVSSSTHGVSEPFPTLRTAMAVRA